MLKKSFLFITLLFLLPLILQAWDPASHIYLSQHMKEIWQDFDPEFYEVLTSPDPIFMQTQEELDNFLAKKFYYIGTTLPDMFDYDAQGAIQGIINELYNLILDGAGITEPRHGYAIKENTYNNIHEQIIFGENEEPNQNLEKISEMAIYARNQGWSPYKKALIYGCYAHLLEDIVAHMVLQPATFGYGKTIDSPELATEGLLSSGEIFHELFTATHINDADWELIDHHLFCGWAKDCGGVYHRMYPLFQFFIDIFYCEGPPPRGWVRGWQDLSFDPIAGFVEAASEVEYSIQNLTHERLQAYMHGWAISLFWLMGYDWDESYKGMILSHPNTDWVRIFIKIAGLGNRGDGNAIILIPTPKDLLGTSVLTIIIDGGLPFVLLQLALENCTYNYPWPSYLESVSEYERLWRCIRTTLRPAAYDKYRSVIQYYEDHSTEKKPNLRSTYADQLEEGLNFQEFIKDMLDGEYTVWYNIDKGWIISRKAGLLGGMYDVDASEEYYLQPGIFDMHFESEGNPIYYIENEIPSTIELKYKIITFGNTIISINGKKEDDSWDRLVEEEITQTYTYINSSISLNVQEALNNGYTELFFEVRTKSKTSSNYQTMFLSDYEDAFNSTTFISDNQLYWDYFTEEGIPRRAPGQDPIANPSAYWPYALSLIPENLVLQDITVVSGETLRYLASHSIQAAGDNTYFTILNGGEVTMKAGSYICLKPGFEARTGCEFAASIDPSLIVSHSTSTLAFLTRDARFPNKPEAKKEETSTTQSTDKKEIKEAIPTVFSCAQNYPNPFPQSTTIKYGLPKKSNVNLTIFNLAGQVVRTLVNGQQTAGFKSVKWDGKNSAGAPVPQGVYFYVFKADDFEKNYKMIVVK